MKLLLIILTTITFYGCDIFDTRDAETPDQTRSNYTTPSERTTLIQNLINSFSDKNANNYVKTFSDPNITGRVFRFAPSSVALSSFQIWGNWNTNDELQYFNNLINKVPEELPISLNFDTEEYGPVISDSASYSAAYTLVVPQLNSNSRVYEGNINFTMFRDAGGVWSVIFWEDISIPEATSWSELKGLEY